MADIEVVIKIPEDEYNMAKYGQYGNINVDIVRKAIANGTPLPKGHGKLKDVDELYSIFKENCDAYNIDNLSFISEMDMNFDLAPTIIEADGGEEDG